MKKEECVCICVCAVCNGIYLQLNKTIYNVFKREHLTNCYFKTQREVTRLAN